MSTTEFRVVVKAEGVEYFDSDALLDKMLNDICERDELHPLAVLTAALVVLERKGR